MTRHVCPKCRRPVGSIRVRECSDMLHDGANDCEAYRAGLAAGVELAKRTAYADKYGMVSFHYTDEALKRGGEGC